MKSSKQNIDQIRSQIPNQAGIYQYYDKQGKLLYVGKAKNLKKRVNSYFAKRRYESGRLKLLVSKISAIKYVVVDNEKDAFLLENNLIKTHQPRYNIQLKDDKSYPFIVLTNERFPRIFTTRKYIKDGSTYFGPYTSVKKVKAILSIINKIFYLRTCNLNLSQKNIEAEKYRVCLEYHIGNCKGPCVGFQTEEDYNTAIEQIKYILRGNTGIVHRYLVDQIEQHVQALEFEQAGILKQRLEQLDLYKTKTTVVSPSIGDLDVYSYLEGKKFVYVNYLKIKEGAVIKSRLFRVKNILDEPKEILFANIIRKHRNEEELEETEIVVSFIPDEEIYEGKYHLPMRGDKRSLLALAKKNALLAKHEDEEQELNKLPAALRKLKQLQQDLKLKNVPYHIECIDNSNLQGSFPVASLVVFKNSKASKRDYRYFKIKTVEGPDDFASMKEMVTRRYRRMMDENQSLPQLLVIDGGKGQLSAAIEALKEMNLFGKLSVIGIAKKLEEIYTPGDSLPLYIDKKSESLKLIQQLRNEAHRFAISFHRNQRSKDFVKSELEQIEGIGAKTADALLKAFKSVKKIRQADMDQLASIIGLAKAKVVFSSLNKD